VRLIDEAPAPGSTTGDCLSPRKRRGVLMELCEEHEALVLKQLTDRLAEWPNLLRVFVPSCFVVSDETAVSALPPPCAPVRVARKASSVKAIDAHGTTSPFDRRRVRPIGTRRPGRDPVLKSAVRWMTRPYGSTAR